MTGTTWIIIGILAACATVSLKRSNKGTTWIIIGILAAALAAFAIPYGFYKKTKDHPETSQYVAGDYVEGDKVKAEGDYVKGDKIVINQSTEVGGDFTQIANFLKSGSTGIFVNLVLNVANFVGERKSINESASVDDYLEWLQKSSNQDLLMNQHDLIVASGRENDQAKLARAKIETVIHAVENWRTSLPEIVEQTKLLPDMDSKLDYLVDQFSKKDSPRLHKGQLAISARILDILTKGIVGAGVKVMMEKEISARRGTAMVAWLLGKQSPNMMLIDIVGDVHKNRISLILNDDASIGLRVYDGSGHKIDVRSASYPPGHHLVVIGVWKDQKIYLWINGELQGSASMTEGFDYLGPTCLLGIDIEGKLSADAVRWSLPGQDVGLNFRKDGIWHGSRFDTIIIWEEALGKTQIDKITEDPFALFRPSPDN
ncbi:MAG: hypothetical protein ACTSQ8_25270 [Candidatus Helarchaeota archaeon]